MVLPGLRLLVVLVFLALCLTLYMTVLLSRGLSVLKSDDYFDHERIIDNIAKESRSVVEIRPLWLQKVKALPKRRPLALVIQWYYERQAIRRRELEDALITNMDSNIFDRILLLHEFKTVGSSIQKLFNRTATSRISSDSRSLSVVYIGHSGRANVSDALRISNELGFSFVVVLSNSDITFDFSARLLMADTELQATRLAYFLSRWQLSETLSTPSMCSPSYQGSHDVLAFSPPVSGELISQTEFAIGSWGYENRLIYEFEQDGWNTRNPCLSVRSYHQHQSGLKSDQISLRVNDNGKSRYVRPSYHPLDPALPILSQFSSATSISADDTTLLDEVLPWLSYLDLKSIAHTLRRKLSNADLCKVPSYLQGLVNGFCSSYHRAGVYNWNCTHLPCVLLQPSEPEIVDCVVARSFRYRCQRHTSFAALLNLMLPTSSQPIESSSNEDDDDDYSIDKPVTVSLPPALHHLSVLFDGRFRVDSALFFEQLSHWRYPVDVWLYEFSGESLQQHSYASEPRLLKWFNWTMGYDKTVFNEQTLRFLEGELDDYITHESPESIVNQWNSRSGEVLFLASNCHDMSGRMAYVKTLMQTLKIDSVGKCLHNRELADLLSLEEIASTQRNNDLERKALTRKFKFFIAFENSIAQDYITEKLWSALLEGAIPLYLGAPNVRDYLPHPHSAILASDYSNANELAVYVRQVMVNSTLQHKHLEWKSQPNLFAQRQKDKASTLSLQAVNLTVSIAPVSLSSWFQQSFGQRKRADISTCGICHRFHRFRRNDPF